MLCSHNVATAWTIDFSDMALKSTHFRFSDKFFKDLDWLAEQRGGLDRTNTLRILVAEEKARRLADLQESKPVKPIKPGKRVERER